MRPCGIMHCNLNLCNNTKDVVVSIDLTDEDKKMLHEQHLETDGEDYNVDDVSMLVWIYIDENGIVNGYSYDEASYYPAEQGETYYDNKFLPPELEGECVTFVKEHYFGNEAKYDR